MSGISKSLVLRLWAELATSIAITVMVVDVTRVARDVFGNHLLPVEASGSAAVIYFSLAFTLVGGFKPLVRRCLRHLQIERPNSAPVIARAA